MPEAVIREARLRPEHAASYPDLDPGAWLPAAALAQFVLERGLYRRGAGTPANDRPLPDEHFEFRGPSRPPAERPGGRSRETDVSVAEAQQALRTEEGRLAARVDAAEDGLREASDLAAKAAEMEKREEELRRTARDPRGPLP